MKRSVKHIFAWLLALCMLFNIVPMVSAADNLQSATATSNSQDEPNSASQKATQTYADTDIVRVSIVLEDPPALEKYAPSGTSGKDIANDEAAQAYQDTLLQFQQDLADTISTEVLDGEPLDVVWNLTLVSNTISANVQYGDIEAIRSISGISDVLIEPFMTGIEQATTTESTSTATSLYASQLGTAKAYELGYYGAGMRIAILDSGINPNHQSFSGKALSYALKQDYGDDYATELNLLTVDEISSKWSQLHASKNASLGANGVNALYRSEKLPFNFNYPDHIPDASHGDSGAGAHGSHVAGIAAANRYIYLSSEDSEPVLAADQVLVQGVAPDAQLLALKVIGSNGGAFASDQFAAVEDALVLGADAINMSIGTDWPGFSFSTEYQNVLDRLQETDTVVSVSAGNYGSLIDAGGNNDLLFIDDVSMNSVCDPGSFTNSFAVASTDSNCPVGAYVTVNGNSKKLFYSEGNKGDSLSVLARDDAYRYVYLDSLGLVGKPNTADDQDATILENQLKALNNAQPGGLSGKIVLMNRGSATFAEKADAAAEFGAAAVIFVNNEEGSVSPDLTNYQHEKVPVATLNLEDREALMQNTTSGTISAHYDSQGNPDKSAVLNYYTGTMVIAASYGAELDTDSNITMSSFSAWGVPGNLALKPEITAPGGNIFSVDGSSTNGKGYITMTGTSMATAQVSGLAALVMQYAKQNNLKEKTGLSYRALTQSLLMSTAVSMREEDGRYYPILQQGAGLANAGNAVTASSFITVSDQPDGKVKVELKDDPNRTGRYTATFTIHNLTNQELTYTVSADLFTQAVETRDDGKYLSTHTAPLEANVAVNGDYVSSTVSVPASGETAVTVTMALTSSQKAALDANYPNGAYIQAFLNVIPTTADGVSHSIPVLGFYGNWTDPSMFDPGYCPNGFIFTGIYGLAIKVESQTGEEHMLHAPYGDTEQYLEKRNAYDPSSGALSSVYFLPLRSYSNGRCIIRDHETGAIYVEQELEAGNGLFHIDSSDTWGGYIGVSHLNWNGIDNNGNPLPEGSVFSVEVTLAPEYYRTEDGTNVNWDALGKGATLTTTVTVDRTAPELLDVDDSTMANGYITVTVQDNEYIGMVSLCRASASQDEDPLSYVLVDQTEAGMPIQVQLPINQLTFIGEGLILKVGDYAGHVTSYPLNSLSGEPLAMVSPAIELHDEAFSAQVDEAMSAEILRQIQEEDAKGVIISADATVGDLPNLSVGIPCSLLLELNKQDVNSIRVLTSLANVIIPKTAFAALEATEGTVWVSLTQDSGSIHMELAANGLPLDTIPGGIQLQVFQDFCSSTKVAVMQKEDGTYKIIPSSVADTNLERVVVTVPGSITLYFIDNFRSFADVPETEWYAEGVSFAVAHELVSGTGNNNFSPSANITRAAIATILYHLQWDQETGFENPFSDVEPGSWYETPIAWAAVNNVISGFGDGHFAPNDAITREQLAVILYNYAKESGMDVTNEGGLDSFTDGSSVSSWARPAMEWAVSIGLLHGVGNNTLLPGGTATRAEAAVVIMHYVQYLAGVSVNN